MGNANLFYAESTCPDEFYLGPWKVKLGLKLGEVAVLWTLAACFSALAGSHVASEAIGEFSHRALEFRSRMVSPSKITQPEFTAFTSSPPVRSALSAGFTIRKGLGRYRTCCHAFRNSRQTLAPSPTVFRWDLAYFEGRLCGASTWGGVP